MGKIYIVGIGPGHTDYLLPAALAVIHSADTLIGGERQLSHFKELKKKAVSLEGSFEDGVRYILKHRNSERIAVLVSGDPCLYSFLGRISKHLQPDEYEIIPGISSFQLAFARIKKNWQNAVMVSAHGRSLDGLIPAIRNRRPVVLFTDYKNTPRCIASYLLNHGIEDRKAIVTQNLSYADEEIRESSLLALSQEGADSAVSSPLCLMIILPPERTETGKLCGIGLGPGDPGLLTVKALERLMEADIVFVPKSGENAECPQGAKPQMPVQGGPKAQSSKGGAESPQGAESLARSIAEQAAPRTLCFEELTFPMTRDRNKLKNYWSKAADRVISEVEAGKNIAFVTLGDPSIYSTYTYLLASIKEKRPNIPCETIPGISIINASAALAGISLVEGSDTMAVLPLPQNLKSLNKTIEQFSTVFLMKIGKRLPDLIAFLKDRRLENTSYFISRAGLPGQYITKGMAALDHSLSGYLSTVIIKTESTKE